MTWHGSLLERQRRELQEGLEAAKHSTREMQTLLDRLPVLVVIHHEGKILWVNGTVLRTLGFEKLADLVNASLFDIVPPSWRAMIESRMHVDPARESIPDLTEDALLTRAGVTVLVEISPARIVTYRGQSARLLVGRDVTEHIGLREQVPMTERLASIGMLAAGVAHEVNNPLAYVLNNIEMARRDIASLGNAACRSREALGTALEGVDRIRTVVRDLLALSRVDDDAIGPIDAAAVIESTLRQSVGTRPTERRLSRLDRIDSRCAHGPGSSCRQPFSSPWRQEQLTPGANSLKSRECFGSPPPQWSRT